ncbi:MAG: hypothetical protein GX945_09330 [Lentisphaerae bacterium]|nr:hypothetical protein [Lentisphaerota bacterium]
MSSYGQRWMFPLALLLACCVLLSLRPMHAAEAEQGAAPPAAAEAAPAVPIAPAAPATPATAAPAPAPVAPAIPAEPAPASVVPGGDGPAHSGLALLQLLQREGALPPLPSEEEQRVLEEMLLLMRSPAVLMRSPTIPSVVGEWRLDIGGTAERTQALLRINSLDCTYSEELAAFQQALEKGDYHGVILDLRSVDGQDKTAAEALEAMLVAAALPVIVLVDADTYGVAESLARSLQQQGAFVMGEPSRGIPGPGRVLPFRDGLYLRLPQEMPAGGGASWTLAVLPDRDLRAVSLDDEGDAWMKQASDTLVAIMVLRRKANE